MIKLTEHFALDEFLVSETAARLGIDNTPNDDVLKNLQRLATVLEDIRARLGKPILITSGYRSWPLNTAIGGSKTSYHPLGLAADFICPGFGSPLDICQAIAGTNIVYDQLIHEYGRWVHFGLPKENQSPRMQRLTYLYQDGKSVCLNGLLEA